MDPKAAAVATPGGENILMDSSTFLHHLVHDLDNPSIQHGHPSVQQQGHHSVQQQQQGHHSVQQQQHGHHSVQQQQQQGHPAVQQQQQHPVVQQQAQGHHSVQQQQQQQQTHPSIQQQQQVHPVMHQQTHHQPMPVSHLVMQHTDHRGHHPHSLGDHHSHSVGDQRHQHAVGDHHPQPLGDHHAHAVADHHPHSGADRHPHSISDHHTHSISDHHPQALRDGHSLSVGDHHRPQSLTDHHAHPHPMGDGGMGREVEQVSVQGTDSRDQIHGGRDGGQHMREKSSGGVTSPVHLQIPNPAMMMQDSDSAQRITLTPRKRRFEQLEQAVSQQGQSPMSISFLTSRETFCMWQIIKEERHWDDSQLVATLLECYDNSLRRDMCGTCNFPLSRYCSKCFDLTGKQPASYGSSSQMQPHTSNQGESNQQSSATLRLKEIAQVVSDGYHIVHGGDLQETEDMEMDGDHNHRSAAKGEASKKRPGKKLVVPGGIRDPSMIRSSGEIKEDDKNFSHVSRKFQCQVCDKLFVNSNKLALHMIKHSATPEVKWDSVRQYKNLHCKLCDKTFTDPDQFTQHMPKHQAEMRHQCKLCKARFFQANVLAMHAKIHIMQPVQVHCELCKTPFSTMYALRQHMRRQVCQKALTQQQQCVQPSPAQPWTDNNSADPKEPEDSKDGKKGKKEKGKSDKSRRNRVICQQCGDNFKSRSHLNRHTLIHSGEKEFGCQECGTACSQLAHLVAHMKSHYKLRAFECRACGRSFTDHTHIASHTCKREIPAHLCKPPAEGRMLPVTNNAGSPDVIRCDDCGFTYPNQIQTPPVPVENRFQVPTSQIQATCQSTSQIQATCQSTSQIQPTSQSTSQIQPTSQSEYELSASCFGLETVQQSLGFQQGTPSLPSASGPLPLSPLHVPQVRPVPDPDADLMELKPRFEDQSVPGQIPPRSPMIEEDFESVPSTSDGEVKAENAPPLPKASYSQLASRPRKAASQQSKKVQLPRTLGEDEDPLPFKCAHCDRTFKTFQHMITHTRSHQRPNHQCPHCGKKLATAFSLANHVRTHTNEKPIKCNVCGESFRLMTTYKEHFRIHTGEKPYLCPHCGKGFARSCNFKAHVNIHKEHKPYTCPECNKQFNHQSNLKRHGLIHSGEKRHVCEVCAKGFFHPSGLAQHMRVHTGEKPYKCEDCGACFSLYNTLVGHRRVHSGDKPFKCEICGRAFALQSNLRSHYRTHNKTQPKKESQKALST